MGNPYSQLRATLLSITVELEFQMGSPDATKNHSKERPSSKPISSDKVPDRPGHVQEHVLTQKHAFEKNVDDPEWEWEEESEGPGDRNHVISVSQCIEGPPTPHSSHVYHKHALGSAVKTACRSRTDVEFAFLQIYDDAPNPALKVENLGVIGLPLSTREAGAIRTKCTLYAKCEDGSLDVDRHVRESDSPRWELDASAVCYVESEFLARD